MILIISTCSERLSYNEFVNPIANIVGKNHVIKHYSDLTSADLENSQKIIICLLIKINVNLLQIKLINITIK